MAKTLRYRTRAGWTTKEAFPADANRLLATEVDDNFLALEDQYAASTGAGIVGFKQAGTGAVDRTVESKLRDVINVKDFGALGNGVADDYASITAAISALYNIAIAKGLTASNYVLSLYFPAGVYNISAGLTFFQDRIAVIGDGSSCTRINYTGASTTTSVIQVASGEAEVNNFSMSGICISSSTSMTSSSSGIYCQNLVRSSFTDVTIGGQDLPVNLQKGITFYNIDDVHVNDFRIAVKDVGISVRGTVGSGPKANLLLNQGKITGGTVGILVGGAFGGLYVDQTDIIGMTAAGVRIDNTLAAEANREIFLGDNCSIDSITSGFGVHVNETYSSNQTLKLSGTWVASCAYGIYVQAAPTYKIQIDGCKIFNNTYDGIRVADNTATVSVVGCMINNNGAYGVNGQNASNNVQIGPNTFSSNTSGDYNELTVASMMNAQHLRVVKELHVGNTVGDVPATRALTVKNNINTEVVGIETNNASFSRRIFNLSASSIGNSTAYDYITAWNSDGVSFRVRGDGRLFADNGTIVTPADYAEMFEWADGNPEQQDRVGHTVSLVGNKIKIAEQGDTVIGVVSSVPAIVGDAAEFRWADMYLKDEWGRTIKESYTVVEWEEVDMGEFHIETDQFGKQQVVVDRQGATIQHSYEQDKIPDCVVVPKDAVIKTLEHNVLNPAYDSTVEYVSRMKRPEWSAIGLVGKLRIKKGSIVNPNWIKMRDITETIEEWLVK